MEASDASPGPDPADPPPPARPGGRRTELIAGLTTFLTMSYIVVVNPQVLTDGTGLEFGAVMTSTVLVAAVASVLMGLFARLPYALAPGMGINAFFTYELVLGRGLSPEQALGLGVWSGILFLLLSATPLRRSVARAIPVHLREAVAGGIGLFLAFIGLKNAGVVVAEAPILGLGDIGVDSFLFLFGLVLAAWLYMGRRPYAFLASIAATTLVGWLAQRGVALEDGWRPFAWPDFGLVLAADMLGCVHLALVPPLITLLFTDLFDSISTFLGVAQAADLLDEHGEPVRLEQALAVDAAASLASGLAGSSAATTYIESTAGIEAGGRTGLTAVVAGLAFLPLLFLGPVAQLVPLYATAPILVILGALMMRTTGALATRPLEDRLPAFVVLITIPLTFRITTGILLGLLLHPLLYLLAGRGQQVSAMMWALFVAAASLLSLEHSDALRELLPQLQE